LIEGGWNARAYIDALLAGDGFILDQGREAAEIDQEAARGGSEGAAGLNSQDGGLLAGSVEAQGRELASGMRDERAILISSENEEESGGDDKMSSPEL
jgi:hypothetical protein